MCNDVSFLGIGAKEVASSLHGTVGTFPDDRRDLIRAVLPLNYTSLSLALPQRCEVERSDENKVANVCPIIELRQQNLLVLFSGK